MLHLALIPFIPVIKKTVVNYVLPTLNGKEVSETILKDLYHRLPPSVSNLVEEKTFVEFGMKHKDALFGNTKTSKKPKSKKIIKSAKKPVKKLAAKKSTKKLAAKAKKK
ncbi:MAG TPA: hypothetical protein VN026_00990 [Bacteroidia bacterium]|jgi:hypothetical protein|nr:hypothetical protein [Bacteroidia bacterium]